jgi:lipopolysaccharide export system protein LptA
MTADDGDVRLGQQTHNEALGNGPVDPPTQGTLRNVTVKLYSSQAERDRDDPEMTLRMGNTRFDADTNRLYTVAETTADGQTIAADRVPITVNGRQMDFSGAGLLMDWNAQTHELKSLVVAHGDRLRLNQETRAPATRPSSGGGGASTASDRKEQTPVHVYLATFDGGVRVVQSGQDRITSPQMTVTVATGSRSAQSGAPNQNSGAQPSAAASSAAAESDKQAAPVDVFWGGAVTVVPAPTVIMRPGESLIRFPGPVVQVREDGMEMTAGDVQYDTADGSGIADGLAGQPLRMTFLNRDGTESGRVVTGHAQYTQSGRRVSLVGGGAAQFTDESKPTDLMRAAWSQACNLTLSGGGERLEIHEAELLGDAQVLDGPKNGPENLHLTAQRIDTEFEPGQTQSNHATPQRPAAQLHRLIATTDAYCKLHDARQSDRVLSGDSLTVEMADDSAGKPYPHFINAQGNVHAQQDQQELWSRRLDATVLPAAAATSRGRAEGKASAAEGKASAADQSQFELQTLVADGDVRLHGKNGDTAAGDTLTIVEHSTIESVSPAAVSPFLP